MVYEVVVGVCRIVENKLALSCLGENGISIKNTVFGACDSFHVAFLTLEHNVADLAVAVQIKICKMLRNVITDHLALHMSCHLVIGSYEYALVVAAYYRLLNRTVKEDNGNVLCFCKINDVLRRIVRSGVNYVDYKKGRILGDCRCDLLGLGRLIVVCVVVLILYSGVGKELVHCRADARNICITVGVIEYGNFTFLRAVSAFGCFAVAAGSQT